MHKMLKSITMAVAVVFVGLSVRADAGFTNLDFSTLQGGAQAAISGVSGPAMWVFVTLVCIGVSIAVIRKLVGRK